MKNFNIRTTRIFFLLILLLQSCTSVASEPTPSPTNTLAPMPTFTPSPGEILADGWTAYEVGDIETAELIARSVLEDNNQIAEAWMLAGIVSQIKGEFQDAISSFETAQSLGAENVEEALVTIYDFHLSELHTEIFQVWDPEIIVSNIQQGREFYQKIKAISPNTPFSSNFAEYYSSKPEDGTDASEMAEDAILHFQNAEEFFSQGKLENAIEEYKLSIEFDSSFALTHLFLGDAYFSLGDYHKAVDHFGDALVVNPNIANGWSFLGDAYRELELPGHAREAYIRTLLLDQGNELAKRGLTILNEVMGNWETSYFEDYGFQLMYPADVDLAIVTDLIGEPTMERGAANFQYGGFSFSVLWQTFKDSEVFSYEGLISYAEYSLQIIAEAEVGATYEIINEDYEFQYGVTTMAVKPYFYSPAEENIRRLSANVNIDCNPRLFTIQFEFDASVTEGLDLLLSKILESFRCDLKLHRWTP